MKKTTHQGVLLLQNLYVATGIPVCSAPCVLLDFYSRNGGSLGHLVDEASGGTKLDSDGAPLTGGRAILMGNCASGGGGGGGYTLQYLAPDTAGTDAPDWLATPTTSRTHHFNDATFEKIKRVCIGKGKFGEVTLVRSQHDKLYYAVKSVSKAFVYERKGAPQLQSELDALASISENPHPFICLYYGAFQDDRTVSMVLEYLVGGEFYNRLKHVRRINEAAARFYTAGQSEKKNSTSAKVYSNVSGLLPYPLTFFFFLSHVNFPEIALALEYLQSIHQVAYRDLKPENILLDHAGHIRLVDFGFVAPCGDDQLITTGGCGTAMYIAPEIAGHAAGHGLPVDWWSLGCVLFECVAGKAPFGDTADQTKFEIFNNINRGRVHYPMRFSAALRSLLKGLLLADASKRFKMKDVRAHPWMKGVDWDAMMNLRAVPPWIPCQGTSLAEGDHSNFIDWSSKASPEPPRVDGEGLSYCDFRIRSSSGKSSNLGLAGSANLKVKMKRRLTSARQSLDSKKKSSSDSKHSVGEAKNSSAPDGKQSLSKPTIDPKRRKKTALTAASAAQKWKTAAQKKKGSSSSIAPKVEAK